MLLGIRSLAVAMHLEIYWVYNLNPAKLTILSIIYFIWLFL
ncbi:hypothetical protein [Photorhabdus australis]